jgi:hypothetical protein
MQAVLVVVKLILMEGGCGRHVYSTETETLARFFNDCAVLN